MVEYVISNKILFSNKGSYQDMINAITEKVNSFGGTEIFFKKDTFYFGGLHLFYIQHDAAVFTDYNTGIVYKFPLFSFSDKFLFSMLISYLNQAQYDLTPKAWEKIVKYLEEKFA